MAEEQVSMAVQGTLLDENGNPLYTNTRSELVWVRVDSNGIPIPVTPTTPYEAGRDSELHTLLQKVVYTVTDQTIGGNKSFTGTTTTADVKPDGTNRNLGTPDLPYAKVYGSEFHGALKGNADSATKLLNSRTLWGQSFDGTANVSGNMTGVGSITMNGALSGATTGSFSSNVTIGGTLGVSGKATLSDELEVAKATALKSTLSVTGLTTANGGIKVAKDKSYTIVDTNSKELTAITSKNANEVSLGVNTTNVSVGIYYGSTRKALVNGDGLTGANVIHSAGYAFKGKVANDNTLYEMMKMTAAKKMNVGSSNIDEIDGVIGGNVVTVTNSKGFYSNGGVAAMGIIEAGEGGGGTSSLAGCVDVNDDGNNNVTRTDGSRSQIGDSLVKLSDTHWGAKPLFDVNTGKILVSALPDTLLGQVLYGGNVNATGACTLTSSFTAKYGITSLTLTTSNASSYEGVFFIATDNGSIGTGASKVEYETGDWLLSDGSKWNRVDNTDAVASVNGKTGVVVLSKADVGLGSVENTALSTWAGTANITTLGTITTGTWNGSAIADAYISSASAWNAKYDKPSGGIPKTDLASGVQTSLEKADSALQSHQTIYSLTVKHNGTSLGTYTPNSAAKTIEITTPTALSGLTDDATHRLVTDTQIAAWNAKWDYNENTIKAVKVTNAGNADTLGSHGADYFATASGLTTANTNITTLQGYFTDGIAKKATADASGNVITTTYATKTERANADITAVSLTASKLTLTRADGNLEVNVPTWNQNTTGNAATATALAREVLYDLNNGTKYRFFESASTKVSNSPIEGWVNGITFAQNNNDSYKMQLAIGDGLHTRSQSNGVWGDWVKYYHALNSNLTTVDWKAKNLTLAGSITGATSGAFSGNVTIGGTLGVTGATTLAGLTTQTIKPNTTDTYTLGDADHRWKEAHIAKTIGDLQGNADTATTADKTKEVEGTFVDEVFSEKVIADAYEVAEVESLKGNTIVANQLVRPHAAITNWDSGDGTYVSTTGNGVYTIKGTAQNGSTNCWLLGDWGSTKIVLPLVKGHKYVIREVSLFYNTSCVRNTAIGEVSIWTYEGNEGGASAVRCPATGRNVTYNNKVFVPQLFDLTQMGIADKVTTIEDFYALCPWAKNPVAYNEGQLVNFTADAIVTRGGVNLLKGFVAGAKVQYMEAAKGTYRLKKGMVYCIYVEGTSGDTYYLTESLCATYTAFTVGTDGKKSVTFTAAADIDFTNNVILKNAKTNTGYITALCLSVSNPATNGKYFPYEESKRKVAITELRSKGGEVIFPDGIKKAGDVYDEIVGNKAIKRCNTYAFTGEESMSIYMNLCADVRTPIRDGKKVANQAFGGFIMNTYTAVVGNSGNMTDGCATVWWGYDGYEGSVCLKRTAYGSDISKYRQELRDAYASGNPVTITYPLDTPIEYELDSDIDIVYPATQGSEISLEVDGIESGERARYGVVDFGSLEWQRSSVGGGRFYIDRNTFSQQLPLAKRGGAIYCDSYTTYNGAVNINAEDMHDRSLYSYINGNLYQPLCIRDTRVNTSSELKNILKGVKLYFELAAGATPVTAPLNARVGYYTNGRKALRNIIGSMDKWSKTLNFGHFNASGAWVDDYEFNHTSDMNIPIVKANFSAKGTDTDNKQLLLVKDADGNGYVVAKIGYRPTGTVSPIKTN